MHLRRSLQGDPSAALRLSRLLEEVEGPMTDRYLDLCRQAKAAQRSADRWDLAARVYFFLAFAFFLFAPVIWS